MTVLGIDSLLRQEGTEVKLDKIASSLARAESEELLAKKKADVEKVKPLRDFVHQGQYPANQSLLVDGE